MADEESVRDGLDFVYDSILTSGCIFEFHWLAEISSTEASSDPGKVQYYDGKRDAPRGNSLTKGEIPVVT